MCVFFVHWERGNFGVLTLCGIGARGLFRGGLPTRV
jgi:hypothetical protein